EHPISCVVSVPGTPIGDERRVYDTCVAGQVPSNFSCGYTNGLLATSYAIQRCAAGGEVVQRARFYSYDGVGRIASVGIATVTGDDASDADIITQSYTGASRIASIGDPFSPQGTS